MLWNEIVDKAGRIGATRRNVFQEEMQKAILTSLSRKGCFNSIVFQGGTALRLFYGNPRFSEDIDLVLNEGVESYDLSGSMGQVGRFCHDTFPFLGSVEVKTQKHELELQRYVLRTGSDDPEQHLKVHIELTHVPSYLNHPRILEFPPIQPAVRVEDVEEILTDKIIALALRPYLKGRDLWDIYFLTKERPVEPQWDLVLRKTEDYNKKPSDLMEGLMKARRKIQLDGLSILEGELRRFLPKQVLDHYHPLYGHILDSVQELISIIDEGREVIDHDGG
ncbi:MAG: nucleotidyl transferase AbiEii/AbiGii toxin family protein [Methanomassiliicoccales archaeon]|nr:nucleotidyl transferase AbiEii/AbiGii toxin family protein [Methanomassiliicoccales archaeon]